MSNEKTLQVSSQLTATGFTVEINDSVYPVNYPEFIWESTPLSVRMILKDNITFASTHYLPLIFNQDSIKYDSAFPFFESFWFRNMLYDLFLCERADQVDHLTYFKKFYNLDYHFAQKSCNVPCANDTHFFTSKNQTAILPFTFGKESLVTLGLCRELGITPVLLYCQEPSQPYEEEYKKKKLAALEKEIGITAHFVEYKLGLFRYGKDSSQKKRTELGWGNQTTILAMLAVPLIYYYHAQLVLMGSEQSNNEFDIINGFKDYPSYDQTSFWTSQQSNMIQAMTNNQCRVGTTLESIEEINVFSILHNRYKYLSPYQFSCNAEKPLINESQWCHTCYKCIRMFLFAKCIGIEPQSIGFTRNLLDESGLLDHYFGKNFATGSENELDFTFYILHKRGIKSPYVDRFVKEKLPHLQPWEWYVDQFTRLHPAFNQPSEYHSALLDILNQELGQFRSCLPA